MDRNKLWKILKEVGIPDHLKKLYEGQEATVRTEHGKMDLFLIEKGVHQGCILSPCLFNLYTEYLMQHLGLDESKTGIKIARGNMNNLRYADDTTLMAENKEELKSLLMKEKSEKVGLKFNSQKTKIMSLGSITSWQTDWEKVETVTDFIFLGSRITVDCDYSHEIKTLVPWKESYDKPRWLIKKQRHHFADKGPYGQSCGFSSSHAWM